MPEKFIEEGLAEVIQGDLRSTLEEIQSGFDGLMELVYDVQEHEDPNDQIGRKEDEIQAHETSKETVAELMQLKERTALKAEAMYNQADDDLIRHREQVAHLEEASFDVLHSAKQLTNLAEEIGENIVEAGLT